MDALDVFRYNQKLINESKELGKMMSGTPEGLYLIWQTVDDISLFILNKDLRLFSMRQFEFELGLQAMNLVFYIRLEEKAKNEDAVYARLIQLREQYETWLKEKLLKEAPSLKNIL